MSKLIDTLRDRINRHEDYIATFESPQGKRVLAHLCKISGVFETNHVVGDSHTTAFKEGQRHIVTSILRYINKDTSAFIKQVEDALQHQNE